MPLPVGLFSNAYRLTVPQKQRFWRVTSPAANDCRVVSASGGSVFPSGSRGSGLTLSRTLTGPVSTNAQRRSSSACHFWPPRGTTCSGSRP